MFTIYRFEDLPLWQQSRSSCNRVFKMIEQSQLFKSDFKFRDQLRASACSVMDNIAEGFERSSRLEFVNFPGIAKGSAGEVSSQLYRSIDNNYIDKIEGLGLIDEYEKLSREIAGFITCLNKSTIKGQQFKERNQTGNLKS